MDYVWKISVIVAVVVVVLFVALTVAYFFGSLMDAWFDVLDRWTKAKPSKENK